MGRASKIGKCDGLPAVPEDIFKELKRLYWATVQNEVQNMIVFHNVLKEADYQPQAHSSFDCDNFKKIFNIWAGSQPKFDKDSTSSLYHETLRRAQEQINKSEDNDHRYARLVLQSSSLLDIDILYEPTKLSQPPFNMQPNLPNVEPVMTNGGSVPATTEPSLYGMSCSVCRQLIRSDIFYECTGDCKPYIRYEYTESGWRECGSSQGSGPRPSIEHCPYRICSPCKNTTESCRPGHQLRQVHYKVPVIANIRERRAQLHKFVNKNQTEPSNEDEAEQEGESGTRDEDRSRGDIRTETRDEDEKQDSNHRSTTKRPWKERLAANILASTEVDGSAAQLALRTCALMLKGNLAPAGNFHLSFMFGPLVFESGLKKLPPSLLAQNFADQEEVQCPFFYRHKHTQLVEYRFKGETPRQRPLLACVKRVYGGAFSGYPESTRLRQSKVIDMLVKEANIYRTIANTKSVKVKRKHLSEAADRVKCVLMEYLESEVDKHLNRISKILVEDQTIRGWNMFTNSCQWLVMRLLSGKDFEYIIPRLPNNLGEVHDEKAEVESFSWPRYLISFGPNIEGFNQSFYQPESMITDFCQSRPTIDYDLIEYTSSHWDILPKSRVQLSLSGGDKVANDSIIPMDALWAMPCDTLSMLQLHLLRQPSRYSLSEGEWNKNRFQVMQLLDTFASLAGALGASLFNLLSRDRQLLSQITIPSARVFGNILASEQVRIVRFSSRWVAYDIKNRVPSAMGRTRKLRQQLQLQNASGVLKDPAHGEEMLSSMVEFFLAPLALVGGRGAVENLGQIFRFHHNGPWITLNGFKHTLVCPLFLKKVKSVRD